MTNLTTQFDHCKSFYGKARVETTNTGTKLYSYNTHVATITDNKAIIYGTYSVTTLRHIKEFLAQNGFKAESKAQIIADYHNKN